METDQAAAIRGQFEQTLKEYWQKRYAAAQLGDDYTARYLEQYKVPRADYLDARPSLPANVVDAYDYYLGTVEDQDWGSVVLYDVPVGAEQIYAVRVTTDGDDGWLELYDTHGIELGVGRTSLELVGWGERDIIRAEVESGEYPPELADANERTLWGKSPEAATAPEAAPEAATAPEVAAASEAETTVSPEAGKS